MNSRASFSSTKKDNYICVENNNNNKIKTKSLINLYLASKFIKQFLLWLR